MSGTDQLLDANEAFYAAMRGGDLRAMERLWSDSRTVTCTHPGWHILVGRDAVLESLRMIFSSESPDVWAEDPYVLITGNSAMVLCTERVGQTFLMATNTFGREDETWRLINHQSEPIVAESLL